LSTTARTGHAGSGKTSGPAEHDHLVERDLTADRLDQVWLTDITEYCTAKGKLYVCELKHMRSNRIVGCTLSDQLTTDLAVNGLRSSIARQSPVGTIGVESDKGSQFRARRYVAGLKANRLSGPTGRVAAAGDSASIEP
jgi:transposase InsO family protein